MRSYQYPSPGIRKIDTHCSADKQILVVDDHEDICLLLADRLEQLGFLVSAASNGVEGLALLQKHSFFGILLDLEMPVMDGLTMLHQLRKQSNAAPVIVMSADPTRTTMLKAIEAGARDYLTKPISFDILQYKCALLFA